LASRSVIFHGALPSCTFCVQGIESDNHLFFGCPFAQSIWWEVYRCFGICEVLLDNVKGKLTLKVS
jgi:hypothetical protein